METKHLFSSTIQHRQPTELLTLLLEVQQVADEFISATDVYQKWLVLQPHEVQGDLGVSVVASPEVECGGRDFINHRVGAAIFRQINALDVTLASIAGLDANAVKIVSRVHRQFDVVLFPAVRTEDTAKAPLGETEGTLQEPLAAFSFGAQDCCAGRPVAVGAHWLRIVFQGELGSFS